MDILHREDLQALLASTKGPCVSLYLPTHRGGAEQDPIGWKNLLVRAEEGLVAAGQRGPDARDLLAPARRLLDDSLFWKAMSDGLAYFLAPDVRQVYRLPVAMPEKVVVGRAFHVKPLLPLLAEGGRFYVLAFSQHRVRLLQGTPHAVQEVDLKGVPQGLAEALRFHETNEPLVFSRPRPSRGAWSAFFHGHGVGFENHKDDLLYYFQQIDRGLQSLLHEERAPLVLASVEYLWPLYRQANTYPHLFPEGIAGNPDHLSDAELHDRASALLRPTFQAARQKAVALLAENAGTGYSSTDFEEVIRAAHQGRVEVLFVAADRDAWGAFDAQTESVMRHEEPRPGDEEQLDFAARHVLLHKGLVYAVKANEVPGGELTAALFWRSRTRKGTATAASFASLPWEESRE
jgi:hypothetical protein